MLDIHCHLTGEEYAELGGADGVVRSAKEAGVSLIVCSGYDLASSIESKEIAERNENVYFSAGFHPGELDKYRDGDLEKLKAVAQSEKCVAIGEIGLDYHFENNPEKEFQKKLFIAQLQLADELGLPVVVHSRDAASDTLELLTEHKHLLKKGGLLHCYSYSPEMVDSFSRLGLYFSFGGPCTFKNANKVVQSVQRVPATRLLSETDCPYLTPVPHRGEFPNQPKYVVHAVEKMAEIRNQSMEALEKQIEENAKRLFFKLK